MQQTVYVGVGSNLGDKEDNCRRAVAAIAERGGCEVICCSDWIRSEPVGVSGQDWYVNGVAAVRTTREPTAFLNMLLEIEAALGRVRYEKWGPRTLDLDILFWGDDVMDTPDLTIPHPLAHERRFVLAPMCRIAPDFVHPVLGRTMKELLAGIGETGQAIRELKEA